MINRIPITAELVRMAQQRCRATGSDLRQEIARQIAETSILGLDPELNLLIDEDLAFSRDDRLVSTFDVNDIVVNGVRFDIRLVGEDNRISVPRYLVGTSYMDGGTLAVSFLQDRSAQIVGYIPRSDWELQDNHAGAEEDRLIFRVAGGQFDLERQLSVILAGSVTSEPKSRRTVRSSEIAQFCGHRQEMKLRQQRELVQAVLSQEDCWNDLQSGISKVFVRRTLSRASVWNHKIDMLAEKVQSRFGRLSKDKIKAAIARVGEKLGGQFDSAQFRQEILLTLSSEELAFSLEGEILAKANKLVENVLGGRSVIEALSEAVRNKTAIDLAVAIKSQRQKVADFIEASSDEISLAFRQLALQPVYATHSLSEPEGIASVNEALRLLEACELAESLKQVDLDLA